MNRRLRTLGPLALIGLGVASLPAAAARAQLTGIEPHFAAYCQDHDGVRLLGLPLSQLHEVAGFPAQTFTGRLTDNRGAVADLRHAPTSRKWCGEAGCQTETGVVSALCAR